MPNKGKLPPAEKVSVVQKYLSGEMSVNELVKRYRFHHNTLYTWVQQYNARGVMGLSPTSKYRKYAPALKLRAVEEYLAGGSSLRSICAKYDISKVSVLQRWIDAYNDHGDCKQSRSRGAIYMAKGRKTTLDERIEIVSLCIIENKNYCKIVEQFNVSYQQIYSWVRRYKNDGADGLADRRGKRKTKSDMTLRA